MKKFDTSKDYYGVLGLLPGATGAEISSAYKKLVSRYHPDKHQGNDLEDLAKEKLAELNEAHQVLSDKETRASYDAERAATGGRSPYPASNYPQSPTVQPGKLARQIVLLVLFLAALPFVLRIVRSPRVAIVIAVAIALAWFGPRIIRKFRKK